MTEQVDCVVIGAGCVGLAVARSLAQAGREVLLLEQHEAFGTETSSRNSEVIHAGIYYPPGSLKAQLCVRGKALLYPFLERHGVPFARCEKLIVANAEEELAPLAALKETAAENGVDDLRFLEKEEAARLEPGLRCARAILSPSTGIFDSHTYMLALLGELEEAGGLAVFNSPVAAGQVTDEGVLLDVGGTDPMQLAARLVVNCAGLSSSRVARRLNGFPAEQVPETLKAKGRYFAYSGKAPFERLIYPMPSKESQGTHYTKDLGGQAKLGPDIIWGAAAENYDVEEEARDEFWAAARRFWPDLEKDRLHPSYAGLRPKLAGPGAWADFRIEGPAQHGVPGVIQMFGIESPGLTSSLALGEYVAAMAAAL